MVAATRPAYRKEALVYPASPLPGPSPRRAVPFPVAGFRLAVLALTLAGALQAGYVQAQSCPTQNFDSVSAPALPTGWTMQNDSSPADAYPSFRFTTVTDQVDSSPNAAFIPDFRPAATTPAVGTINDVSLVSPTFVPVLGTVLRFDNRYNFRLNNYTSTTPARYDGGVLEISINGGAWTDVVAAGGGFAAGGYYVGTSDTISASTYGVTPVASPIAGRRAWSGLSTSNGVVGTGGIHDSVQTIVDLPAAAIGQSTRVRFRSVVGPATSTTPTSFPLPSGTPGWWIDSLDCATPPRLAQHFSPSNTPVGTPTTLTVSLQHAAGGATLTSTLTDTLPAGLLIASTPNASTTCGAATLTADAGTSAFTLAAGATIPAGGCSINVDVVASAAGIYQHTQTVGQLQTSLGNSPNTTSLNYQATQAGALTYSTGFEAGTGSPTAYPTGADTSAANLSGKDGWSTTGSGVLNNARVQVVSPASGAQHVRVRPVTPNGNGYQGLRSRQFLAGTTNYAITELRAAIQTDATTPTPAPFDVTPLYLDANGTVVPVTRLRFAGANTEPPFHATNPVVSVDQSILVEDAAAGGFVDTHVDWTGSATYKNLRIVSRRSDAAILVCLDGNPIYVGQGASADVRQMQFMVQRQTGISTNTYDVDDVLLDNRNSGTCADADTEVAPVVAKVFSLATVQINTPFTSTTTLHNWNTTPLALSADFVDALPAELEATAVSTTCTGGAGASFTSSEVTLGSGATIPADGSCTITTTLRGISTGSAVADGIAIGDLQTAAGSNATAPTDSIAVTEVLQAPTLSTTFAPTSMAAGTTSTLRVTLGNPNFSALLLTADLADVLPAGLSASGASTTCTGSLSANAGSVTLQSGARIPGNGGSCVVQVTVTTTTPGTYTNSFAADALQTTGGNNALAASATLTVTPAIAPTVDFVRTVGTDLSAGACGTEKVLTVSARTSVNFCYRLTNNTDRTLRFHSIDSANYGRIANYADITLAPGQTHQVNDIRVIVRDVVDTASWAADDALVNYSIARNPAGLVWEDISGSGAVHSNTLTSPNIPLPFTFSFYGEPQTRVDMMDGALTFDRNDLSLIFVNGNLPNASPELFETVLPYWDRWQASSLGTLYWEVRGSEPNRRLIAQWQDRKFASTNPRGLRYQAVLFEQSGEIAFVYDQVDNGVLDTASSQHQHSFGKSATIGLNFDGDRAAKVSYFGEDTLASPTPVINNGDSILFTPSQKIRFSDTDTVGVMVVSAQVQVDASAMNVPVRQGTGEERTLSIGNLGAENLSWAIDPTATAGAHLPPVAQGWPDRDVLGVAADTAAGRHPPRAAGVPEPVPAYAFTLSSASRSLVSFDVASPTTLSTVNRFSVNEPQFDVTGMEFAGPDFTTLYGVSYGADDSSVNGVLHRFNTETGEATWIGRTTTTASGKNEARSDFAWDPVDRKLYLLTYYGVPHTLNLYTVDPQTAETTFVHALNGAASTGIINAIAVNGQGQMYGVDISNDRLIAIDKRSGETAVVGPLGYGITSDQSLEFDERSDTLYLIGGRGTTPATAIYSVFRVDTQTGAATLVDATGYFGTSPSEIGTSAFAIAASHPCSLPGEVGWLSLSETQGVVGPHDVDRVRLSFDPSGLADGDYSALLCLASNDPVTPNLRIPVTMSVNTENLPPLARATLLRRTVAAGQAMNLDLSLLFDDPDQEVLTYSMSGAPAGLVLNPQSGVLSGTVAADAAPGSPYAVVFTARDPHDASASLTLELVVLGSLFIDGFE